MQAGSHRVAGLSRDMVLEEEGAVTRSLQPGLDSGVRVRVGDRVRVRVGARLGVRVGARVGVRG